MLKTPELRFQAGRMEVIDSKIKPNPAKGEIHIYLNQDNLLCFQWLELNNPNSSLNTEPLVIFQDEWSWEKLSTKRGRAYMLRNKSFQEDRFFFWMQSPNSFNDSQMESTIQRILKTGELSENTQEDKSNSELSDKKANDQERNKKMLDDISKVLHANRRIVFILTYSCVSSPRASPFKYYNQAETL